MPDLEDLRDRTFNWSVRRGRPLDCRILERAEEVGALWHGPTGIVHARIAGLEWRIRNAYKNRRLMDRVGFADGDTVVAEAWTEIGPSGAPSYVLAIDEVEIYRLPMPSERRTGWYDAGGRLAVGVREMESFTGAGEITVLPHAILPHVPILILMAAYEDGRRHAFK